MVEKIKEVEIPPEKFYQYYTCKCSKTSIYICRREIPPIYATTRCKYCKSIIHFRTTYHIQQKATNPSKLAHKSKKLRASNKSSLGTQKPAQAQPRSSRASSRASTPSPDEDEFPDEWFDDQTDTKVKSAEIKNQQESFEFSQPATNFSDGASTKAQLLGWEIHNIIFKIPLKKYPIGFFDPKKICVMASKSMKGKGKGWLKLFQNYKGHRIEAHIRTKKGDSLILYHKTISNSEMPDIRGSQTRQLVIGVLENLRTEGFDFDMEKLELVVGAHNVIDVTDDPRFKDAKFENKSSDSGTVQIDRSNGRIHVEFQDSRAALEGKIEGITGKFLKSTEAYLGKNFTGDLPDRVIKSTEGYSEIKDTLQNYGSRQDKIENLLITLTEDFLLTKNSVKMQFEKTEKKSSEKDEEIALLKKLVIKLSENTLSTNNLVKTYESHNLPAQTHASIKDPLNKKKQDYDLFYA